jgi:hypothetical protein
MSGMKQKYVVASILLFGFTYAVNWNHSLMLNAQGDNYIYPASFPDTLCVATSWSPIYRGFDIHEGSIYFGTRNFDISIIGQFHRLMSNYQLTVGFPVLKEETLLAGLQCHYHLSTLHGVETIHKGSCSGGLIVRPQPTWQVSLYSMHLLSFPRDSCERFLEPRLTAQCAISILPSLNVSLGVSKTLNLPWRVYLGATLSIVDEFSMSLNYEPVVNNLSVQIHIALNNWRTDARLGVHSVLGFDQRYKLAYEY